MLIDHVLLTMPAGGEAEAKKFWVEVLRMSEEPRPEGLRVRGGYWFRQGACSLHVEVEEDFRPQRRAHPAFEVKDVGAVASRLVEAGYAVDWNEVLPDRLRFFTTDPFGNRLEFLQYLDAGVEEAS